MAIHLLYNFNTGNIIDIQTEAKESLEEERSTLENDFGKTHGWIDLRTGNVHYLRSNWKIVPDIEPQMQDIGMAIAIGQHSDFVTVSLRINPNTVGEVKVEKSVIKNGFGHVLDLICRRLGLRSWKEDFQRFHIILPVPLSGVKMNLTIGFDLYGDDEQGYTMVN